MKTKQAATPTNTKGWKNRLNIDSEILIFTECLPFHRLQSEHPADEMHQVIRGGRVLGGLEPTRAFGDARYKWTREVQEM